jgi:hypothetical protein
LATFVRAEFRRARQGLIPFLQASYSLDDGDDGSGGEQVYSKLDSKI